MNRLALHASAGTGLSLAELIELASDAASIPSVFGWRRAGGD